MVPIIDYTIRKILNWVPVMFPCATTLIQQVWTKLIEQNSAPVGLERGTSLVKYQIDLIFYPMFKGHSQAHRHQVERKRCRRFDRRELCNRFFFASNGVWLFEGHCLDDVI